MLPHIYAAKILYLITDIPENETQCSYYIQIHFAWAIATVSFTIYPKPSINVERQFRMN